MKSSLKQKEYEKVIKESIKQAKEEGINIETINKRELIDGLAGKSITEKYKTKVSIVTDEKDIKM